jgi:hypothetical protein
MSKALELADSLKEAWVSGHLSYDVADDAAAELRRLAAVEAELKALKRAISETEPVARIDIFLPHGDGLVEWIPFVGDPLSIGDLLYTLKGIKT